MATLVPWTTLELGDFEIFIPAVPSLVVHTWYTDEGQPDSTVTYFWEDEATGLINHEVVFAEPVGFDVALQWAQEHAPTRGVERIHIKHGPSEKRRRRAVAKTGARKKKGAARAKAGARAKPPRAKKRGRKTSAR
jgi:hypothetical protein